MSAPATPRGTAVDAQGCRLEPLANVYHPFRLELRRRCVTATGVVRRVQAIDDGDVHVLLEVDPPYRSLLNRVNTTATHGWLVVELVPADLAGCVPGRPPRAPHYTKFFGICTGAGLTAPAVGAHVEVRGAHVIDQMHGWAEVHPAWYVGKPRRG